MLNFCNTIFHTYFLNYTALGGFIGCTVAMWLAIRLWPCIIIALVLYLCTSGMLHDFPSYGWVSGEHASVSSGMEWDFFRVGFCGTRPGVMVTWSFTFSLWRVPGSRCTVVAGCHVLGCGGCGVYTLWSCAGGGDGAWGTAMLKMAASCLIDVVCFYPRCGMGLDGVDLCSASVRSEAALVTESSGNRLGKFFWTGNSSVVLDTSSDAVLGM